MKNITLVNKLAAQIRRNDSTQNRSTSMRAAWATIKAAPSASVLEFEKKDGTTCTRVVCSQWDAFYTVTGTGRPTPAGLVLFADLAKVAAGSNPIISAYSNKIISIN